MGLDKKTIAMAKEPNYATLTTLFKSGAPQTHVMWVDTDGENILINTEIHRRKYLNVKDDPRVNVMIWKHDNEFKFVEIRGVVVGEITGEDALKNTLSFSGNINSKILFEILCIDQAIENYIFLNPQNHYILIFFHYRNQYYLKK